MLQSGGQNQQWPTSGQIGYITPAVWGPQHLRAGELLVRGSRIFLLKWHNSRIFKKNVSGVFVKKRKSHFFLRGLQNKKSVSRDFFEKSVSRVFFFSKG